MEGEGGGSNTVVQSAILVTGPCAAHMGSISCFLHVPVIKYTFLGVSSSLGQYLNDVLKSSFLPPLKAPPLLQPPGAREALTRLRDSVLSLLTLVTQDTYSICPHIQTNV